MATKLFVGGLAYAVGDDQLRDLFAEYGTVESAQIIMDRETNRSKGFGFVEMSTDDEAKAAIKELDGKEFQGRSIVVNEARPRENSPNRFSNDRGGFNRNGGGGGGGNRRFDRNGGGGRY